MHASQCCVVFILALCVMSNGHEVQELDGAPTKLGERAGGFVPMDMGESNQAKAGGFFSALQTSGSFVMQQAGGFEEEAAREEEKLGDSRSVASADLRKSTLAAVTSASEDQLKTVAAFLEAPTTPQLHETTGKPSLGETLADAEQTGYFFAPKCNNKAAIDLLRKKIYGRTLVHSNCKLATATSCRVQKERTTRLIRQADGGTFMATFRAIMTGLSDTCSKIETWSGTSDSKLYVDVFMKKVMTGVKSGGKWNWSTVKTCKPEKDTQANWNKFCDATNKAKLCHNNVPNTMRDDGFATECAIF